MGGAGGWADVLADDSFDPVVRVGKKKWHSYGDGRLPVPRPRP